MTLKDIYDLLSLGGSPDKWWPGDSAFEICVGAILAQATSWSNVEKSLSEMRRRNLLNPAAIRNAGLKELAFIVKSSLYHNQKARKLKEFAEFIFREYGGDFNLMSREDFKVLRKKLLGVWGVGPETADSILLYALGKPVFVVDAYTKRIFTRLGKLSGGEDYGQVRKIFEDSLPKEVLLYQHYHGLIVEHAKKYCLKNNPRCGECVLEKKCEKNLV
ncbi:MAG TPA: endonuclease III domain-containing protein [Candidatus Altiarchaeales archaeon]|nr:endonuclease III domain-containing protein [Candidatus Altiarchaeales archaeon]